MDPEFQPPAAKEPATKFEPYAGSAAPPPKKKHGCFFWGCLISLILVLVIVLAIAAIAFFAYRYAEGQVKEYTDTVPIKLPVVTKPEEEMKSLHERVDGFLKAADAGEETETLVLTADDLNALIQEKPNMKGRAFITIDGDKVKSEISYPVDSLVNIAMTRGRYFNGTATLRASLKDGKLVVTPDEILIKGKPLPEEFMKGLREENVAEKILAEPDSAKAREAVAKLESLEVKDGKIILKSRVRAKPADEKKDDEKKKEGEPESKDAGKKDDDPAAKATPDVKPPGEPAPKKADPATGPGDAEATKPAPGR